MMIGVFVIFYLKLCGFKSGFLLQGNIWEWNRNSLKWQNVVWLTNRDSTYVTLHYGCGWGGRVVVLQPEGRQFDPQFSQKNLHAEVSLSKMLNPELCLIEQQSAANRCMNCKVLWVVIKTRKVLLPSDTQLLQCTQHSHAHMTPNMTQRFRY